MVPGWVSLAATVFTVAGREVGEVDHVLQMRKLRCVWGGGSVTSVRLQGGQAPKQDREHLSLPTAFHPSLPL